MEFPISPISDQSTLVELDHELDVVNDLNRLSPLFLVSTTKYGGRGCFANKELENSETIFECKAPISSTIIKPFKKEVCTTCFQYQNGKTLKFKISKKLSKETHSLYFCEQDCLQEFVNQDIDEILTLSLLNVEKYYLQGLKKGEPKLKEPPKENLLQTIDSEWKKVEKWISSIEKLNSQKLLNQLPTVSDSDYTEIKYIFGVLFQQFKYQQVDFPLTKYYHELDNEETKKFDLRMFDLLQSTDLVKVQKYPYLLYSYINIFKFVRILAPMELQPFITPENIKQIIGKNLSNAFGIWSQTDNSHEDKEFFGFGVYPCASFFNHSCDPNLIKIRNNNKLIFKTKRKIQPGEELCIDYGNYLDEDVSVRQAQLKEWFFDCSCTKCIIDLEKLSI